LGELWKEPGQTLEQVKAIRETEAKQAAEVLGARFVGLDLGDYPLSVDEKALWRLVDILSARALVSQHGVPKSGLWKGFSGAPTAAKAAVGYLVTFAPDILITHTPKDPFNPDHPVAYEATEKARQLASGAGVASAFRTIRPPEFWLFEPHQPELCGFVPNLFLDITSVWDKKRATMEVFASQAYLVQYYSQRAEHRANHARRVSGLKDIERAEAFQRVLPQVLRIL
jgi:4-oxalomesaconate hydratase